MSAVNNLQESLRKIGVVLITYTIMDCGTKLNPRYKASVHFILLDKIYEFEGLVQNNKKKSKESAASEVLKSDIFSYSSRIDQILTMKF